MRVIFFITSIAMLLLLTACNSSGTLKVYNQTSFNVFFTVGGLSYTVPGHTTKSVEISTATQTIFTGVVEKNVPLVIYGETWMIRLYENDEPVYIRNTTVAIRSGETTKIYCAPILAAVKVTNHGSQAITTMSYTTHQPPYENTKEIILPHPLTTDEEFFSPIPPLPADTQNSHYYYTFQILLADGNWLNYGGPTTKLYIDQEFPIEVYDQAKAIAGVK
jgi:hypothetical protein